MTQMKNCDDEIDMKRQMDGWVCWDSDLNMKNDGIIGKYLIKYTMSRAEEDRDSDLGQTEWTETGRHDKGMTSKADSKPQSLRVGREIGTRDEIGRKRS